MSRRFVPPLLDKDRSNSLNSENTTLFLLSCYQYILSAIVLSVGPPFRQSMAHNCEKLRLCMLCNQADRQPVPFVITIITTLLIASYLLFDPAEWLYKLMELTYMSWDFKLFILVLGIGGFAIAYLSERLFFPKLARSIGKFKVRIRPKWRKKRKQYKIIQEGGRL